jgi:hypothetical protein
MPRRKSDQPVVQLRITLTLYPGRDDRLIAFLHNQPRRGIARAIKQALLTGVSPLVAGQDAAQAEKEWTQEALDELL